MMRLISDDVEVKISDKIILAALRKGAPNKAVWGTFASSHKQYDKRRYGRF